MRVRAVAIALCLCCPVASGTPRSARRNLSVAEQYLFSAANAERARYGLRPLRWSPGLYQAASQHAWRMAERGAISHQFPGELNLKARGAAAGLRFLAVEIDPRLNGENAPPASGATGPPDAVAPAPPAPESVEGEQRRERLQGSEIDREISAPSAIVRTVVLRAREDLEIAAQVESLGAF